MVDFMSNSSNQKENPLKKYFRTPKIYLKLPSKGNFYPTSALVKTESGEYPVFPMTARDEIMIKTPDALLNGESTVQVIQSCIPNIKDAWQVPSIDLDSILIAIRIASYGETMDVNIKTPVTGEEKTFSLNLLNLLDQFSGLNYDNKIIFNDLIIHLRPLNYKEFTKTSLKTFEEQRIFRTLTNKTITEEEKLVTFNKSFKVLTDLTILTLEKSIAAIEIENQLVREEEYIKEFVANADRSLFNAISEHVEKEKNKFSIKPLKINATNEEIEKGVPPTYEIPVTFDQSNFFV